MECFVEPIDFIHWGFNILNEFSFGHPFCMHVAPVSEFDEVFILISVFALPFPDDVGDFEIKDAELVLIVRLIGTIIFFIKVVELTKIPVVVLPAELVVCYFLRQRVDFSSRQSLFLHWLRLLINGLIVSTL